MEKCNTYLPPIDSKKESTRQDDKWDEAIKYYNTKQFNKVVPTLLDYVNNNLQNKKTAKGYSIPHGSVTIEIEQTETTLHIKCPFLNIESAKKIPLMRRLTEMRMHPLNLANISLENNFVLFYYNCPLSLCEPYKIYNVLREICQFADIYDDEFIEKYNAKNLQEPKTEPFAETLKTEAYTNYQKILDEGIQRFDYYMSKRNGNPIWYTLNITLKRLEYYAAPQGYLRTEIERAIDSIYDQNKTFYDRLLKGKESLLKLKKCSFDKFSRDLYMVEVFIPHKYSGKKENIRENWEAPYENAQELINATNTEEASLLLLSNFYSLYYYNLINEDIDKPLREAMAKASGLPWNDAATILLEGMKAVMEDSIFDNDFGMDLSKVMGAQMQQSMAMMQQIMKGFNV